MEVVTMINAVIKIFCGLIELVFKFLWWFIRSSAVGKLVVLLILLLIVGGVYR
jgi:hypothetical protein